MNHSDMKKVRDALWISKDATDEEISQINEAIAILDAELAAPEPEPVGCRHKRYSVDVHEQTGTCYDCGAEGRMRFVVDAAPQRETDVVEALRRCLDELRGHNDSPYCDLRDSFNDIIEQAESALDAKNVDHPPHARDAVAWMPDTGYVFAPDQNTAPVPAPKREWQSLTPDEINNCAGAEIYPSTWAMDFARAIESKLKEKNHG